MKKFLLYFLILIVGSTGVYFGLLKFNEYKKVDKHKTKEKIQAKTEEENIIPSKDDFISEAIKLQTLAENTNGNDTCKCFNVKDLDRNTNLTGSILVYTVGDLFVSNVWVSNGYYMFNSVENISSTDIIETNEQASVYCGEANSSSVSPLCLQETE